MPVVRNYTLVYEYDTGQQSWNYVEAYTAREAMEQWLYGNMPSIARDSLAHIKRVFVTANQGREVKVFTIEEIYIPIEPKYNIKEA